jgi:hypothetical protein
MGNKVTEQPEEEKYVTCALCAGTGKIRDRDTAASLFPAASYITIDPSSLEGWNLNAMCGT